MEMRSKKLFRCAIYTRKSTEHNLDLEFNSLDAQREACEAYIKSQAHEGWRLIPTHFDDGAFSGASLDRPALQELLAEVRSGKIDVIVVYKVDRLTRSLADFAKLVELFDQHSVSFVSVTQSFNTTSSMGRLTLNVLLSFAQFEREVIGERVRDKIAASKRKGLWVGGPIPLGYATVNKKLVIVPAEAETVMNGSPAARAAQQATSTIPIVMMMIGDPVRAGFVASLARPGGNMTGYSEISPDLIGKRLAVLKECVPALARVAFLWNPDNASNRAIREALMGAIPTLGLQLISVPIRDANEFDGAFSAMMRGMPNAAVATNDPLIRRNMRRIIDFAATNRLPAIYQTKEFVAAGGLMSYGTDEPSMFRRGASYVHRILQGAKPADLPIEQPTRFELVINLKTARALGLTIPETLLATADEVIQ